ncbi:MAG: P-II family nitrogen regulator [Pseudomonadota bacterium]
MSHKAKKVVIITERFIRDDVIKIIEECGATGYTITNAAGKGARGVRRGTDRATVVEGTTNIKFEIITFDDDMAEMIAERVADEYFNNYSGITYLENVYILRPEKFSK